MSVKNIDQCPHGIPSLDDINSISTKGLKQLLSKLTKASSPPFASREYLFGNITWMLQVIESGEDPIKVRQELLKLANSTSVSSKTRYLPGTRLVREWHGVTHEVVIEENGYRWKNNHYRSLSKIAEEITGVHWSGPRFLVLKICD